MSRRLAAAAAALAGAVLAACGGSGPSADEVIKQTAGKLGEIKSADLGLRLMLEGRDSRPDTRLGFELQGPLDLRGSKLPIARVTYTQISGTRTGEATFISTGERAFVMTKEVVRPLSPQQVEALGTDAQEAGAGTRLPIGRWMQNAERDDGDTIDGTETDHVVADVDAPAALRDIFSAVRAAGRDAPDLEGRGGDEIRKAVDEARLEFWSGREDHLLRRLRLRLAFKADVPDTLSEQLGDVVGGRLSFDLDLANINEPVSVEPPS